MSKYTPDAWKRFKFIKEVDGVEFYSDTTNPRVELKREVDESELKYVAGFIKKYLPHILPKIVILDFGYSAVSYALLSIQLAIGNWGYGRYPTKKYAEDVAKLVLSTEVNYTKDTRVSYDTDSWSPSASELKRLEAKLK